MVRSGIPKGHPTLGALVDGYFHSRGSSALSLQSVPGSKRVGSDRINQPPQDWWVVTGWWLPGLFSIVAFLPCKPGCVLLTQQGCVRFWGPESLPVNGDPVGPEDASGPCFLPIQESPGFCVHEAFTFRCLRSSPNGHREVSPQPAQKVASVT
jgi:hypothetical protein